MCVNFRITVPSKGMYNTSIKRFGRCPGKVLTGRKIMVKESFLLYFPPQLNISKPNDRKPIFATFRLKKMAHHICIRILFPSTMIVFILKSIPTRIQRKNFYIFLCIQQLAGISEHNLLMSTMFLTYEDFLMSLPIVEMCDLLNSLLANRHRMQVFPTPESPISRILNK